MPTPRTRSRWSCCFLSLLALALGCSSWPEGADLERDPTAIAGREARTIVVVPLNVVLALPTELDSSTEIVTEALVEHIEASGKTAALLDFRVARALWIQATQNVSESHRAKNFDNAAEAFVRLIAEKMEFDAVIIPSLFLQNAKLKEPRAGLTAHWDGANQRVEWIGNPSKDTPDPKIRSLQGASILVYVFDRSGEEILEKRTGLELIEHLEIEVKRRQGRNQRTWVKTKDGPAIEDKTRVMAAIAHALYPFLLSEPPAMSMRSTPRSAG